ncbi:MAG TPA: hypothetical protein VFP05_13060 [Thermomicrobiales bacterium]|nr:hypothetical protein [Thermomicrobiales bacterium]
MGVNRCVPVCPEDEHCCVSGPPTDTTVTCVDGDECCETDECDDCATCINGYCEPDVIACILPLVGCCVGNELICTECCHDSDCGDCELCHEGSCVPCERGGLTCCDDVCVDREECCVPIGEECGLLDVTPAGGDWPPQLDCCDGLVCCETQHGSICADCCSDHECPKGSICCAGQCREMECCIDDILVGLDPNRRCPEGCGCFEGICDCHCQSNHDCAWGTCCCKDGTCSKHCCEHGCHHDKECGYGTCCCHDGSCSAKCCKTPTPPATVLPGTGSGPGSGGNGLGGVAAVGAAVAAYVAARKLREQPEEVPAEE